MKLRANKTKITVSCCLLLAFLIPIHLKAEAANFREVERRSPLKGKSSGSAARKLERDFHKIYKLYKDRVVFISTEKNVPIPSNPFANDPYFQKFFGPQAQKEKSRKLTGLGTGFIISKDGYICTNYHVIAKVDSVRVRLNRKEYDAQVIGSDSVTDLALLKVEGPRNFKPVYFGDSSSIRIGGWAIAIGNPFGFDKTFTVGVVSAVRGDHEELGNSYIQTDASINQGNSGGPLLNLDGEVIGVNRMIYSQSGGSLGIGFSIPINTARIVLEQLYTNGKVKWGFIGVRVVSLNRRLARRLGAPSTWGALVTELVPKGPAEKAGIKRGDIILRIARRRIKNSNQLVHAIARINIDKTVNIEILRNRKKLILSLTIRERP